MQDCWLGKSREKKFFPTLWHYGIMIMPEFGLKNSLKRNIVANTIVRGSASAGSEEEPPVVWKFSILNCSYFVRLLLALEIVITLVSSPSLTWGVCNKFVRNRLERVSRRIRYSVSIYNGRHTWWIQYFKVHKLEVAHVHNTNSFLELWPTFSYFATVFSYIRLGRMRRSS